MLEKIGLPAKPSLRGNTWVVDATHCQGCSSQFTFINRKHHCRRCGGIFCNSCTLQRMVLRGQGDSPVRICDPCKKLEEAARFELRHGHRSRAGRGSSRVASKNEDEVMAQIGAGDTEGSSSRSESDADTVSNIEKTRSSASCSNGQEDDNLDSLRETGSATPEDLRQQALYEKKKYKILKGEGKPDEALKAFKRGKELERQADALEIALRKARRKVLPTENVGSLESGGRNKPHASNDKDKDDLLSELKELGWSEMDIHNEDRKPTSMTLEGELATLIREIPQEPGSSKKKQVIDKNQVTAHKRKALMLKRGGKLAEAKEELKKAKVLEKQIEEEELLAGAEDSDDELSALIQGMDDDKHDNFAMEKDHDFHLDDLTGVTDSLVAESNFEVTEEDMQDPEIAAALKSFGWSEELYNHETSAQVVSSGRGVPANAISSKGEGFGEKPNGNVSGLVEEPFATQRPSSALDGSSRRSKAEIQRELLGIKRKALALRREGKNEEAEEVLKTAKLLEAQIAEMEAPKNTFKAEHAKLKKDKIETSIGSTLEGEDEVDITENDLHDPSLLSMLQDLGWKDEVPESVMVEALPSRQVVKASAIESSSGVSSSAPRTKAKIQRELLGLKRKALDLRRKGNMEEAEETLRMTKVLEAEIEELEEPKKTQVDASEVVNGLSTSMRHESHENLANSVEVNKSTQEAVSADVGPMSLERTAHGRTDASQEKSAKPYRSTEHYSGTENKAHRHMAAFGAASASKPGNSSNSIDLMDFLISNDRSSRQSAESLDDKPYSIAQSSVCIPSVQPGPLRVSDEDSRIKGEALIERKEMHENKRLLVAQTSAVQEPVHQKSQGSRQDEILSHKKKALALKREGKLAEAKEELKQAKLLEKSLGEDNTHPTSSKPSSNILPEETKEQDLSKVNRKPLSGREHFKIQQESLSHKRQALKLRKEGKVKEAEIELDLAKSLEAQLEESNPHASGKSSEDGVDDVVVEDVLDPELLSALRAIGVVDAGAVSRGPKISEPVNHNAESRDNASQERLHLQEQIKAEKVRALNLKRAGKQAEALDAFRHAKLLEKKLNAL